MMAGGQHIHWGQAKQELMKDFDAWIKECDHTRENNARDMIEFLYQRGYIRGKKWKQFVADVASRNKDFMFWVKYEPMCEGKIPPSAWV